MVLGLYLKNSIKRERRKRKDKYMLNIEELIFSIFEEVYNIGVDEGVFWEV